MNVHDTFIKIQDYVDTQNIVDSLEKYFTDDELQEFCEYIIDEYDIEMESDGFFSYDDI